MTANLPVVQHYEARIASIEASSEPIPLDVLMSRDTILTLLEHAAGSEQRTSETRVNPFTKREQRNDFL